MMQRHRIRTEIGKDQRLTVELKQDYDLLEILSLKFTQKDIYTSLCADYGVVCGRITANQGYGVANARVSIFIPLDDVDEEDPVVSKLYPYKSTQDMSEEGYKYNLFPKRKQHTGHTPTGTFPDQEDILTREEVLYVYEKYYKYTVKTNDAGDFMIWGVPVGTQTIHVDVDLSDMGCQSLVPYDFIYEGVSEEKFENNYTFRSDSDIAGLPQTITFEESVEVYPFWGNEDLCEIGITRTDYDLTEQGIRIEPYSIMMGGTFTDSGKDSVRVRCNVDNQMGEKCSLITGEGDIEAIRFTGLYEDDVDGTPNYNRPILEAIQLDSQINENGNFFFRVPMNMGYYVTNEFGELVETKNTQRGIPTRGTYRFRLSLQNDNGARKQYRGKYLVPQIKEHQLGTVPFLYTNPKSYAFSTNLDDYPIEAIDDITGINNNGFSNDYFYSFRYNRVYTVSSFINQYYNKGWWEKTFSLFTKDKNESFIGIKEIQPSLEEDCANNNEYFPINDAVSNFKFKFLIIIILNFLERIYLLVTQFALDFIVEFLFDLSEILYGFKLSIGWPINKTWRFFETPATRLAKTAKKIQITTLRRLGLVNYPDCYECNTDPGTNEQSQGGQENTYEYVTISEGDEEDYVNGNHPLNNTPLSPITTSLSCVHDYDPNSTVSDPPPNTITINIPGLTNTKNYVIKYVIVAGVQEVTATQENIDNGDFTALDGPQGGAPATSLTDIMVVGIPEEYKYRFIGYASSYPPEGTTNTFIDFADDIHYDVYDANNLSSQDPKPTSVSGTALQGAGNIVIKEVYFISELTEISSGVNTPVESGCEKYDTIYDADNDMSLRAYLNDNGSKTYDYFKENPGQDDPYPDIFYDGNEDPCDTPPPIPDIVATFSKSAENDYLDNNWVGERWPRRLALKQGWGSIVGLPVEDRDATASGYSEFADGQYALVAAAGKNSKLIKNYSRRKLLGTLMCAGITSYSFGNSWLNGSLYFFQFRRRRGGDSARYCKDLIYRNEDDNGVHYYYRSTPYHNGNFIGEIGESGYGEILFPTTIMDLGPRNMFINEICVDPELDVNCSVSKSIGSTSYQDINDLMEYIIASKEVKEQGRLNVQDLFDRRGGGKIDGDIAQLLNFNSQVGIYGYNDEDDESPYYVSGQTLYDGYGPVGIDFVFSEDDEDTEIVEKDGTLLRLCINAAGNLTETAQEVPYYKWNKRGDGFGSNGGNSEKQEWSLGTIHTTKYQGGWVYSGLMENDPYGDAGGDPTDNINSHYYDGSILPPLRDCDDDNYSATEIPIGGPFFFYFGLRTGKSSWNKFVKNFGPL
jgi:hypothetical protein